MQNAPEAPVVASEPRLFIGQVPLDFTEADLRPYFEAYGSLQSVHVVKSPDGKSKGCAIVTFGRWSEAEAALEEHNGKTILPGGRSRPLIVSFANPKRVQNGETEPGIAARKLFVGQVAPTATADDVRALFAPCGDVLSVVMVKRPGEKFHKGCAFVQFAKWSHCELAIETHNGKTTMTDSRMPLVVKFADAKKKDTHSMGVEAPAAAGPLTGAKRGGTEMQWPADSKRQSTQAALPRPPVGPPPGPMTQDSLAAMMSSMNPMFAKQLEQLAANPQTMMAAMNLGLSVMALGGSAFAQQVMSGQPLDPQQAANLSMMAGAMTQNSHGGMGAAQGNNMASQAPFGGSFSGYGTAGQSNMVGGAASMQGNARTGAEMGAMGAWGPSAGAQQGMEMQHGHQQMNGGGMGLGGSMGGASMYQGGTQGAAVGYGGGMANGMDVSPGSQSYNPYMQQQATTAVGGGYGVASGGIPGLPPPTAPVTTNGKLGRGLSQDKSELKWKLFVGQVPVEASEYDLWNVFSGFGDICELHVLTKPEGGSRGCAFITYANKSSAEAAIKALDMYAMGNKTMRVKYADSKPKP